MRFVRISQTEIEKIRVLYESVMSKASHGLFYREGNTLGKEIAEMASEEKDKYLETCARIIKGRGWADDIAFNGYTVIVKGSIEAATAEEPTCHRLRGIIHAVVEHESGTKLVCIEEKCKSVGDPYCEFTLREMEGK